MVAGGSAARAGRVREAPTSQGTEGDGVTPIEPSLLQDAPIPYSRCPHCHEYFLPFMRGQVQRGRWNWWRFRRRPYCALICSDCKNIVGWEEPERHEVPA